MGPRTISIRSILSVVKWARSAPRLEPEGSLNITPSTRIRVFFESAPRMNTDDWVPRPPLATTSMPGVVFSTSSTVVSCFAAISCAVITETDVPPVVALAGPCRGDHHVVHRHTLLRRRRQWQTHQPGKHDTIQGQAILFSSCLLSSFGNKNRPGQVFRLQGDLLTRLPIVVGSTTVVVRAFVPCYGCGTAGDLHSSSLDRAMRLQHLLHCVGLFV